MLDFTPSVGAGAPRATPPVDRPLGSTESETDSHESFASALDALAGGEEAPTEEATPEDPSLSPYVPAFAPLPESIQPGLVPGWVAALAREGTSSEEAIEGGAEAEQESEAAEIGSATNQTNQFTTFAVANATGSVMPSTTTPVAAGASQAPPMPQSDGALSAAPISVPSVPVTAPGDGTVALEDASIATTTDITAQAGQAAVEASVEMGLDDEPTSRAETSRASTDARFTEKSGTPASAPQSAAARVLQAFVAAVADDTSSAGPRSGADMSPTDRAAAALAAALVRDSAPISIGRDSGLSFDFSHQGGQPHMLGAALKGSLAAGPSLSGSLAEADALPSETRAEIVQAIRLQLARGGGEAHIKLEPHYFGELKVSIKVDQGQVTARLEAEMPVVREWLQSNQALLRSSLADHSLTLDRLEIAEPQESHDRDPRDGEPGSNEQRQKSPSQRRRRPHADATFEVVA